MSGPPERMLPGVERRRHERIDLRLELELEFLDPGEGLPAGSVAVRTSDLSLGGACLVMDPCAVSTGTRVLLRGAPDLVAEAAVRWVLVLPGDERMKVGVAWVSRSGSWPV